MRDTPATTQNIARGISFKIISVLLFLAMAALVKSTKDIPVGEIIFFRSSFAIIPIALILAWRGQLRGSLKTQHLSKHIVRALVGLSAMSCLFFGILNLPLPDATTIYYATPLVIVVLSVFFFKENVRLFRWSAVLIGFAGVLIIVWPNLSIANGELGGDGNRRFGVIIALTGAVLAAFATTAVRSLVKTEGSASIVLYFSGITSLVCLATIPFGWVMPPPDQFAILVMTGIVGGFAQIFLTESFRHADLSIIAPFEYSSLIFSILIGYFVFAEIPTLNMLIGGVIVTAAGVAIIWRERYLGLKRETKKISVQ